MTAAASSQVERASSAEATIKTLVRDNWSAIADSLPASVDPKRFARLVFNSIRKTPRLAESSATSLIGSMLAASALGLEVDTPLGEAYLVPYRRKNRSGQEWTEAQLIVGYQGIVKLYRQHPSAGTIRSGWVGARDEFSYAYGTEPFLHHVPAAADRGAPVAFWASYSLKDGTSDFAVLSPAEVLELRAKSADEKRDVADPQHWMARKTALRQVLKLAPKSTALAAALLVDEQPIGEGVQAAGLGAVTRAMQLGDVNLSAVAGEIEGPVDRIDETTGEVLEEAGDVEYSTEPAPVAAPAMIRKQTGMAVLREFGRCGIDPVQVPGWLGALGVPRDELGALTQDEALELLEALRVSTRESLADLGRAAQGE